MMVAHVDDPRRLRVLHYHPRALAGDGGVTNALRALAAATALDADITVACLQAPGTLGPCVSVAPVGLAGRGRAQMPKGLEPLLAETDLLVLHSAWVTHNARAAALARARHVPYVLTPQGAYDPLVLRRHAFRKRVWWLAVERRLVDHAAAVHIFFEEDREKLADLGYRGRTIVAPNIVDVPPGRRWDGGSGGYLLWLGRYDPEHKGLDTLLRAVAALADAERPQLRLHGPDWHGRRSEVEQLRDELGLAPWVQVGGPLYGDAKWEAFEQAAAFVYPSRWEGCPVSLGEAASLGMPALVTPYAFAHLLSERGGAVLTEHEPEALAEGIRTVLSPRAKAVGAAAAAVMRTELSPAAISRSWLAQASELA